MSRTAHLRRQHDAALDLTRQISAAGPDLCQSGVPFKVSILLAKLQGLLRIHFAQEDKALYPFMAKAADPDASQTAHRFQSEMGNFSAAFDAFASRWGASDVINADPAAFRRESEAMFTILTRRIERENDQLYTLADKIDDWQVKRSA